MKNNTYDIHYLKMANTFFVYIFITLMCSSAIAKSIKISDQFGNPLKNVVVSLTTTDAITGDKLVPAIMDQIDKQFAPQVLVIQKNQTVFFPNNDDIRHHLYSFSKPKPFEFKMFKGGESKKLTFEHPGIVVLGCNIHDQMVGYIYVTDKQYTVMTNDQGIAKLPSAGSAVQLWHPRLSANKIERKNIQLPSIRLKQPLTITLTLLENVEASSKSKFGSKKFQRGNQ
jgi:plastocyanin